MRIVDGEERIENATLREALRAWLDYRKGKMPPASVLAGAEFCLSASHLMLDVLAEGDQRFRITAAGDGLWPVLREPAEGLLIHDLASRALGARLRRVLVRCSQTRMPIVYQRVAPASTSDPGHEGLALPFLGSDGRIDRLLVYLAARSDVSQPPHWQPAIRHRRIDDD